MKALTICQPYADLIAIGEKRVENRSWPTRYRGPIAVHAGKSRRWLVELSPPPEMVLGAVVAIAEIVDVLHIDEIMRGTHDQRHPWLRQHPHTEGDWCWVLDNVQRLASPIPCKGAQGLWNFAHENAIRKAS